MSHILIVGRKFSHLTEYLLANGHEYTLLQDKTLTKSPDKVLKRRQVVDFSSKAAVLEAIDRLEITPDAAITVYENYILPTAWITEHLHLPGLPIEAAEACTDKFLMRSLFAKAPEKISPDFGIVENEEDLIEFAEKHTFPLILKPANLAKSLLVTKNHSMDELQQNYKKSVGLLASTYQKYAPHRQPKLIIEEFLEGSIHSVDAFVDAEGRPFVLENIVDYQTGYDIGYDDNFHYSRLIPSKLSTDDQAALRHCAEVGIKALGMKSSPAHVEIIMTKTGPQIVEIGARNGGYRERMHALANGLSIPGLALQVALGRSPVIKTTRNEPCAVLELFPKTEGIFESIDEATILSLPSLNYLSIKATPGQFIGKAADGYKMAAVVILHNTDDTQFRSDLAVINSRDWVKLKPETS
jgi:biotin carboxylase